MKYIILTIMLLTQINAYTFEDYKKMCENESNAAACTVVGDGEGVKQDYFKASKYYKKACDLKNGAGCYNLGNNYVIGEGVKQDYFKASEYFKKACDLEYGGGCFNLGINYYKGKGAKQDKRKAKELFGKACDLKESAGCKNYRALKEQGY